MNTQTGEIMDAEALRRKMGEERFKRFAKPVARVGEHNEEALVLTGKARVGRNASCPCGSGKKFKACCERH